MKMHQQLAQARLIKLRQLDRANRAAVLGERLGGGARFRRHQIADGFTAEAGLAGDLGEFGIHARTEARASNADDRKQFVARPRRDKAALGCADRPGRWPRPALVPLPFLPRLSAQS